MARALCIQIATAAPNGLGELSTTGSNCKSGFSSVFGSTLSLRKNFRGLDTSTAAGVNSSWKLRISSKLHPDEKTGDGQSAFRSSMTTATPTVNVQSAIRIPKGSEVVEEDLEGLSIEDRLEAVQDAKLAMNPKRELLEQPTNLEDRGKELHHPYSHLHVGERWPEIQGKNHWEGLLDPLDPVLRGEVMRYGEFAQATYDAFEYDTHSAYSGSCRYNKKHMLEKVGLTNRGYEVTDYLYATAGADHPVASFFQKFDFDDTDDIDSDEIWDKESNFMGFVAVATDEAEIARLGRRDIVIVWRGTVTKLEWLENLRDYLAPSAFDFDNHIGTADVKVEAGFLKVYVAKNENSPFTKKCAREQVHIALSKLVRKYKNDRLSITVAGHSLGSALAHLCAYDLAENDLHYREDHPEFEQQIPITVFSFAGPRVGNDAFRDRMDELGVKVLRLVNKHDKVPKIPGLLLNEGLDILEKYASFLWNFIESLPWTYTHCGVEVELDNLVSPFLRNSKNPMHAHNLEAYIHLINGYHGRGRDFQPIVDRDIALVNKNSDFLRPKLAIPADWRQEENKGLMRTKEGRWVLRTRDPEDIPVFEDLIEESNVETWRGSR